MFVVISGLAPANVNWVAAGPKTGSVNAIIPVIRMLATPRMKLNTTPTQIFFHLIQEAHCREQNEGGIAITSSEGPTIFCRKYVELLASVIGTRIETYSPTKRRASPRCSLLR